MDYENAWGNTFEGRRRRDVTWPCALIHDLVEAELHA